MEAAQLAPKSIVTPLSAVRAGKLAKSLRLSDPRAFQTVKLQLLLRIFHPSKMPLHVLQAMFEGFDASTAAVSATSDATAAMIIQAAVRSFIARGILRRARQAVSRLQTRVRQRTKNRDPPMVVELRKKLAFLPVMASLCIGFGVLARFFSSGPFAMHGQELIGSVLIVLSLLLGSAGWVRLSIFGISVPECAGITLLSTGMLVSLLLRLCTLTYGEGSTLAIARQLQPWELGEKAATYGVLLGLLPAPPLKRTFVVSGTAIGLSLVAVSSHLTGQLPMGVFLIGPAILLSFSCCSSYFSAMALQHAAQYEETLGDMRQVLHERSSGDCDAVESSADEAWRKGPLSRIHLLATQASFLGLALLHLLGYQHPFFFGSMIPWNFTTFVYLVVRCFLISYLPQSCVFVWARLIGIFSFASPAHSPFNFMLRLLVARAFGSTFHEHLSNDLNVYGVCGNAAISEFSKCDDGWACFFRVMRAHDGASTATNLCASAPAIMNGFVAATLPFSRPLRLVAIAMNVYSQLLHAISGSMDAVAVDIAMTGITSMVLGVGMANIFVHSVLAFLWKRKRVLAELEIERQKLLHRRTVQHLRAAIVKARSKDKAAERTEHTPPIDQILHDKLLSEMMSKLLESRDGRRILKVLHARSVPGGSFSRRSKRGRSGMARSVPASLSSVHSPLASISEYEMFDEKYSNKCYSSLDDFLPAQSAFKTQESPSAHKPEEFIFNDLSKFTTDSNGFLIPRDAAH